MRLTFSHAPRLLAALLLCAAASVVYVHSAVADDGAQDKGGDETELIRQLRAFEERHAEIKDLSARFSQKRYSPLLKKPIAASGTYRSVAGLARWDTEEPHDSVMMIRPGRLEIYYPDQKTLEVYPIKKRLGELLATPQPDVDQWQAAFQLDAARPDALSESMRETIGIKNESDYLLIGLTPLDKEVAKMIKRLIVVVDQETGLSRGMAWSSEDGEERTEIVFTRIRQNAEMKQADLLLQTPESTRVVYPLGPVAEPETKAK